MSKQGYDLSNYVEVADRLSEAFERWPEGSMQGEVVFCENPPGWLASAAFYRNPDDPRPGMGHAFEPVPGKTPYTRDSEAMNAETSAWGRALVAVGLKTKHIASANDVRARTSSQGSPSTPARVASPPPSAPPPAPEGALPSSSSGAGADEFPEFAPDMPVVEQETFPVPNDSITDKQLKFLKMLATKLTKADLLTVEDYRKQLADSYGKTATASLTKKEATAEIERLKQQAVEAGLIEG